MKKYIILILLISLVISLFSNEKEDLKFALGLYSDGNLKIAETELQQFLKKYPQSSYRSDVVYLLANTYLKKEKYTESLTRYLSLYKQGELPNFSNRILLGVAQSYYFLDDYKEAETYLREYLTLFSGDDSNWLAYYYLGEINIKNNNLTEADEKLKAGLERRKEPKIYNSLIRLAILKNDVAKAEELLSDLYNLPESSEYTDQSVINLLNYHLKKGDYQIIKDYNSRAIKEESPYYDNFNTIRAIALFELSEYENSLELLGNQTGEISRFYKGLNNMELGHNSAAIKLFEPLSNSGDTDISARSIFYLARLSNTPEEALGKLNSFILDYPEHKFIGEAMYLLGLNNFKIKKYNQASEFIDKALGKDLEAKIREKADFLKAESNFQLSKYDESFAGFEYYLKTYPQGEYRDEAYYKTGFYYFDKKEYPEAYIQFDELLKKFPKSSKVGMANFYIGEMFYLQSKFSKALVYYSKSYGEQSDDNWINLRIAQINFQLGNYDEAESYGIKVPEYPEFLFAKNLLNGNIAFAKKRYNTALMAYDKSIEHSEGEKEKNQAMIKKAWTLYQMNRFDESTRVYQQIAKESNDKNFILKAAVTAFSAENYEIAIENFETFLLMEVTEAEKNQALIGLANSYYNLEIYNKAYLEYKKLVKADQDQEILQSSLNGMVWSALQNDNLDLISDLALLIKNSNKNKFKISLYQKKIEYSYNKKEWDQIDLDISALFKLNPSNALKKEMNLLKAEIAEAQGDLEKADKIYKNLELNEPDADMFYSWAMLKVKLDDKSSAVSKLRKASMLSREEKVWTDMLSLEVETSSEYFMNDYNKFLEFASPKGREIAQIEMIKWNISEENFSDLATLISSLQNSKYKEIKAETQYLKGLALYREGRFDEAIPELLRVRYLYPEMTDIRLKSEVEACNAYIDAGYKEEAEGLLDMIKDDLDKETLKELGQKIYGAGE